MELLMNDFTKEELKYISSAIIDAMAWNAIIDEYSKNNQLVNINSKILYMIDNYCEHEEQYEDLDCNPMRCKKCLEVVE